MRPDPARRQRLEEITANLTDRIAEAEREGWTGEAEGLNVSLSAATGKLAQLDTLARRQATIHLGMPGFAAITAQTITTPAPPGPGQPPP